MKKIGLIGGMSWESTALYYQLINEGVKDSLGGLNNACLVLESVNFHEIEQMQRLGDWNNAADRLIVSAQALEQAGADFFAICTNTMHKVADKVADSVSIPLLHIVDATAAQLVKNKVATVGLLGTAFTMEEPFYRERLADNYGLRVITPDANDRKRIHNVIYDELCLGKVTGLAKKDYLTIINKLVENGAQAIILGCTEITMLVKPNDTHVTLYDTTRIHAESIIAKAVS